MRLQQNIWLQEHAMVAALPGLAEEEPASGVVAFTDYLRDHNVLFSDRAVDIGSGKGRNSVHLARLGFEVYALDYIELAHQRAIQLAERHGVAGKIHTRNVEIDSEWPFEDNFFDVAVDSFASIDIETVQGG